MNKTFRKTWKSWVIFHSIHRINWTVTHYFWKRNNLIFHVFKAEINRSKCCSCVWGDRYGLLMSDQFTCSRLLLCWSRICRRGRNGCWSHEPSGRGSACVWPVGRKILYICIYYKYVFIVILLWLRCDLWPWRCDTTSKGQNNPVIIKCWHPSETKIKIPSDK